MILANPHLPHVLVTPRGARAVAADAPRAAAAPAEPGAGQGPQDALPDDLPERIAQVWARMLGLPGAGPDDNLFELGADSLAIVQIAAEMRNTGLAVSPGDLFAHPTAAALADRLVAAAETGDPGTDGPPDASPPAAERPAEAPGDFPDADLSNEDLAQVLNLFRSGQDKQ
ncbi:acyl carrier protein [Streptomyces sp. DHE7-1]|nr:acyl carrier protein [Streptomyces sp. DHE7-1]